MTGKTIDAVQVIESVAQSTLASTRTTLRLDASWQVLRLLRLLRLPWLKSYEYLHLPSSKVSAKLPGVLTCVIKDPEVQ